jgi:uncharacterized protein
MGTFHWLYPYNKKEMIGFRHAHSAVFGLFLAALVAISAIAAQAERVEDLPKPTDYVNDFAHVLSPEAIARLDHICSQLDHTQANAQVAVVTVRTLDGIDSADFANALEEKWKIGRKGSERGVLVLLAVDDHKRRIEVGYGLEGILPDGKVGDIGREMVPDLRANDFDGAVTLAVNDVAQVIAADAKVTLDDQPTVAPRPVRQKMPLGKLILLIILVVFFGGFFLLRFLLSLGLLGGFGGWGGGGPWIGGGGLGGGGGGDSGGSGFGGFGGDGGGFGGGGAGGDW